MLLTVNSDNGRTIIVLGEVSFVQHDYDNKRILIHMKDGHIHVFMRPDAEILANMYLTVQKALENYYKLP